MYKTFCDGCGEEIERNYVSDKLIKQLHLNGKKFMVEVLVGTNDTWDDGDLCLCCLLKIIDEGYELINGLNGEEGE